MEGCAPVGGSVAIAWVLGHGTASLRAATVTDHPPWRQPTTNRMCVDDRDWMLQIKSYLIATYSIFIFADAPDMDLKMNVDVRRISVSREIQKYLQANKLLPILAKECCPVHLRKADTFVS